MTEREFIPSRVDFHVHYREEDPQGVIEEAGRRGVVGLGLVSKIHTPDDIGQAIAYGKEVGVEVIPGVEKLCRSEGELIDIIAIGFDYSNPAFRQIFGKKETQENGKRIASEQKELLEALGFTFEGLGEEGEKVLDDLLSGRISEKAIKFCELIIRNPENFERVSNLKRARQDVWKRVSEYWGQKPEYLENQWRLDSKFLWEILCKPGDPCYVDATVDVSEAISSVHEAGGVVLYSPEGKFRESIWQNLIKKGIDGILGWHGRNLELERRTILQTRKLGLLVLGGSDYNPSVKEWKIGSGDGTMFISQRRLYELRNYLKIRNFQTVQTRAK